MTDPIADMLTRIRNAQASRKPIVEIPYSKVKNAIIDVLLQEGYVEKIEIDDVKPVKKIVLTLKYHGKVPAIRSLVRESKPGHRKYCKAPDMPHVLNDYGLAIVSTSQGIMTNKSAKKLGIGGELLCSVY